MFGRQEPEERSLSPELESLERQLAGIDIAPLSVDRDRLMFEAGRASAISGFDAASRMRIAGAPRWFWPAATAAMTAACLLLGAILVWRSDGQLVAKEEAKPQQLPVLAERSVAVNGAEQVPQSDTQPVVLEWTMPPMVGYLETRRIALTRGIRELQLEREFEPASADGNERTPATARELMEELIPARTLGMDRRS